MLLSGAAFRILQGTVITAEGSGSTLARAIGGDAKGKISLACYVAAIALAFVNPWLSDVLFVAVALMWLAPDPRIERALAG